MSSFILPPSSTRLLASPRIVSTNTATSWFDALKTSAAPSIPQGIPFPAAYGFFINPWTPLIFGILYFAVTKTISHYSDGKNRIQGRAWNAFIVAHNVFLAVYSGWTFTSTAPPIFHAFLTAFTESGFSGLTHVFCDSDMAAWSSTHFPFWCYTFYLSKFYEVVDTAIILAKGKKVGMLQSYHHTGAVWTMFAGFRTMSMPIWIFVVFNSFIHTAMYTFYTFSALKLPFPTVLKKNLTRLQITQFLVGGSLAASYLFIQLPSLPALSSSVVNAGMEGMKEGMEGGIRFGKVSMDSVRRAGGMCVEDPAMRAAVILNVLYLVPLTYLFAAFFFKSYKKNQATKAAASASKAQKSQ